MKDCYRLVKKVEVGKFISILPSLQFVAVNVGSTNPGKSPCYVVLGKLPDEVFRLVEEISLDGTIQRLMFRKLGPYQSMAPHIDKWMPEESDWHRYQLPLISHSDIKMRWPKEDIELHLEVGNIYEVNYSLEHEVVNPTPYERIHLQIDMEVNNVN